MSNPADFHTATPVMAAPLQGYTDAAWRKAHRYVYGSCIACYFTPFARVEHGTMRPHDLRDTAPHDSITHIPQIIFNSVAEFDILVNTLSDMGHRRIDLNLGCPFPPQVKHGRGAGALVRRDLMQEIAGRLHQLHGISFSLKMRLGIEAPDEWRMVADIISGMPLIHISIHPRTARQQYSGLLHLDEFAAAAHTFPQTVIFNGDIRTPDDIDRTLTLPRVAGVMVGRGLLARPSLAAEWHEKREWTHDERMHAIIRMHELILNTRASHLCGEAQMVSAMRPFWDYLEPEIGHKAAKAIRKASNMTKYTVAVNSIFKTIF